MVAPKIPNTNREIYKSRKTTNRMLVKFDLASLKQMGPARDKISQFR